MMKTRLFKLILLIVLSYYDSFGQNMCGGGISGQQTFQISNFNPLLDHVRGNPITASQTGQELNGSLADDLYFDSEGNVNYEVNYLHQHSKIPSNKSKKSSDSYFKFDFDIKNNESSKVTYYYTIYWQCASYKFLENSGRSHENFYGSFGWNEHSMTAEGAFLGEIELEANEELNVVNYYRIRGNPRNEPKMTGDEFERDWSLWVDSPIENNNDWWMNRWLRLPRAGDYSFLLVVTTSPSNLPNYLINHQNPYDGKKTPWNYKLDANANYFDYTVCAESCNKLNIIFKPDLGVHPDVNSVVESAFSCLEHGNVVGDLDGILDFSYFEDYKQVDYNYKANFYNEDELIHFPVGKNGKANCFSIGNNNYPQNGYLKFVNSGSSNCDEELEKNFAGANYVPVKYGKIKAKYKFPKMFNSENVWNGLFYAFWLSRGHLQVFDQECGQVEGPGGVGHVEVDFEFFNNQEYNVGDGNYGTEPNYYNSEKQYFPQEWDWDKNRHNGTFHLVLSIFDYLNDHDFECPLVTNPIVANETREILSPISGNVYKIHRGGGESISVVGIKRPNEDDFTNQYLKAKDFFGKFLTYEIEWNTNEIIFRINNEEVAYFSSDFTIIPNVYMQTVFWQSPRASFENSLPPNNWQPYNYSLLPFWKDDFIGELVEFTIE